MSDVAILVDEIEALGPREVEGRYGSVRAYCLAVGAGPAVADLVQDHFNFPDTLGAEWEDSVIFG
jgi:adenylosuccinate synthase